ncbi:hypothetical protein ABT224_02050 [Streptomyces sp. NPDC001584]|uniref:hypothetical protein n=1 Tax=Streptomyces sp. NPDC001584 TaxID=3154521 RepID=UPI00332B3468
MTSGPLRITPRFTPDSVRLVQYTSVEEREQFVLDTFGSQHFMWDAPDILRFDKDSRVLVGAEFQMPYGSLHAENADRAPGDTVLTCLRDLDVLDEPLEESIGIAPDVALVVQHGAVVGWSLTAPARYLTTGYADPDPDPPLPETRRLLSECLDLVTDPVVDDLVDGVPAAVARLRAADEALRAQREDRHRADALLALIGTYVEDYGNG